MNVSETSIQVGKEQEGAASDGYMKALDSLIADGMNPRKARRYLDSIAKRSLKKAIKNGKKNKNAAITNV